MGSIKEKRKKEFWTPNETHKFLSIWRENNHKIRGIGPKKELFQELSAKLAEEGVTKSGEQFQKKIENMKMLYNKYKPNVTGGSPSKWQYFTQVHEILKSSHFYNQDLAPIVDSEGAQSTSNSSVQSESSNMSEVISDEVLVNIRKRKSTKPLSEIIEVQSQKMTEFLKEMQDKHEKRMEEITKGREEMQQRVEAIGDRVSKVLELIEKKLNQN